jgi:hypothetical protein
MQNGIKRRLKKKFQWRARLYGGQYRLDCEMTLSARAICSEANR